MNQDAVHAHQVSYVKRLACSLQQCNFIPYVIILYLIRYIDCCISYFSYLYHNHDYITIITVSSQLCIIHSYTIYHYVDKHFMSHHVLLYLNEKMNEKQESTKKM